MNQASRDNSHPTDGDTPSIAVSHTVVNGVNTRYTPGASAVPSTTDGMNSFHGMSGYARIRTSMNPHARATVA